MTSIRRLYPSFILLCIALFLIQPVSGFVIIEYFHQDGCVNCAKTDPIVQNIKEKYPDRVSVRDIKLNNRESVRLLVSYGRTEIPVIVINRVKVIDFPEITENHLIEEIQLAESGAYQVPISDQTNNPLMRSGYIEVALSYILGIMTGLSPCLLGTLVVMITVAANTTGSTATSRFYPAVFGAGLVTAYLMITAGILFAGVHLSTGAGFGTTLYAIAGLITIGFGLLQIGVIRLPALAESRMSRLISRFNTLKGAFVLGIIFAILLAPCAAAPFVAMIDLLMFTGSPSVMGMILAFGLGVLTPFLFISIVSGSVPRERILQYSTFVQKTSGILLIVLGIWLLMQI
jgi:cytochrome c-type biogenesis protein